MKRITSKDLMRWTTERDGQEHLPLLIRRLIKCQSPGVLKMQFPAGDNIALSGWDGRLHTNEAGLNVPLGSSVWEIGCRKDFREKLEEDYQKRTADPKEVDPTDTTYVGVTLYAFNDKDKWIDEKLTEGVWKDVQVIDALVLEEWIEEHPTIGAWLAKFLERDPDITPLDDFWETWRTNSKYCIMPGLVLNGRTPAKESLLNLLSEAPSSILITSSTIEESIAFVAAAIFTSDAVTQFDLFSRTAIVENENDFRDILVQKKPLILIAKFEDPGIINKAIKNGHHVIVPCGFDTSSATRANIVLPRIKRKEFEAALEEMGFSREEAERHTRDCGQNISVLRRQLQFVQNQMPEWAGKTYFRDMIPALIAGSWDEQKEADKDILSELAGIGYEEYISCLSKWLLHKDAPILNIRSIWRLTSSPDAWSVLGRLVLRSDLDVFEKLIVRVFDETDPALEMDPDQRYLASAYNKTSKYSHSLKEGLLKSLIQLAIFGESFEVNVMDSPQYFADHIVRQILHNASRKNWCSLNYYLPLLSEASPHAFLEELKESMNSEEKNVLEVYKEAKGLLTPHTYHTGLLWGLENLAGSPSYILNASLMLAQLAEHDPGGSVANRPINSLIEIYVPWFVQTEAGFELRKTVLRKLAQEHPDIAWSLFLKLLPDSHAIAHPIHKCNWRFNTQSSMPNPTYGEIWDFHSFLFDQLLHLAAHRGEKLKSLFKRCHNYGDRERSKLFAFLRENAATVSGDRFQLWSAMRKFVDHHRSYLDCEWALAEDELNELEDLCKLFEPQSPVLKHVHLFEESWYQLPGVKRREMSDEKHKQLLLRIRTSALVSVYNAEGLAGLFELAEKAGKGWVVGTYCAEIILTKEDEQLLLQNIASGPAIQYQLEFVESYIATKAVKGGQGWMERTWNFINETFVSPEHKAKFLIHLPQQESTWKLLELCQPETESFYWKKVHPWMYRMTKEEKVYAIGKLQKAARHRTVLDQAAHFVEELEPALVADILLNAAIQIPDDPVDIEEYDASKLFKIIHDNDTVEKEKKAQLEWIYINILTESHSHHKPYHLLESLTNDPSFFVDTVRLIYRPDQEEADRHLSEEELLTKYKLANAARSLLESWTAIPGMDEEKKIDEDKLLEWVNAARVLAKTKNISRGVDYQLGKLFACYPRNTELWPCEAICNLIDTINNEEVTESFKTAIFNGRGIYSKAAYEGGEQERRLSEYFGGMSGKLLSRWPVTASVMDALSKSYLRDAKREDESARIDELYR